MTRPRPAPGGPRVAVVPVSLALAARRRLLVAACSDRRRGGSRAADPTAPRAAAPSSGARAEPAPCQPSRQARRRARLHPERPVRPVLPRPTGGLYEAAGLEVEFQNKIDPDLVTLVGQGAIDVGISDGTSVIPAVSQGIPVQYIATIYGKFPSIVFAKTSSGIKTAADLKGKKLGIPGRYGSSWIMLQALLASADLTPEDLTIVEYPDFGQGAAVAAGRGRCRDGLRQQRAGRARADRRAGHRAPRRRHHAAAGPGPDLEHQDAREQARRDRRVRRGDARAMARIAGRPAGRAGRGANTAVTGSADGPTQKAILDATIDAWTGPVQQAGGLGAIDPAGWTTSIEYLTSLGLVPKPGHRRRARRTDLLPPHG